jgi:hypothetical protein
LSRPWAWCASSLWGLHVAAICKETDFRQQVNGDPSRRCRLYNYAERIADQDVEIAFEYVAIGLLSEICLCRNLGAKRSADRRSDFNFRLLQCDGTSQTNRHREHEDPARRSIKDLWKHNVPTIRTERKCLVPARMREFKCLDVIRTLHIAQARDGGLNRWEKGRKQLSRSLCSSLCGLAARFHWLGKPRTPGLKLVASRMYRLPILGTMRNRR